MRLASDQPAGNPEESRGFVVSMRCFIDFHRISLVLFAVWQFLPSMALPISPETFMDKLAL